MSNETDESEEVVWAEKSPVSDLLGFDLGAAGVDRSGLAALVNSALVAHPRLPMLDVILERGARRFATTLRQMTNADADAALDNVTSIRFGDFLQAHPANGAVGVLRAAALGGPLLLAVDSQFTHHAVDLLLGGRRGAVHDDARALTAIELSIVQQVLHALVDDLGEAFSGVAEAEFSLDRIETAPRFAAIAQETSVCVVGKFKILLEERASRLLLLIPHASLEPIEEKLRRGFALEEEVVQQGWRRRLAGGLRGAALDVAAVVGDQTMRIADLRALKPGDVLPFGDAGTGRVELRVGASSIASGRIGKQGDRVAVRLDAGVDRGATALETERAS